MQAVICLEEGQVIDNDRPTNEETIAVPQFVVLCKSWVYLVLYTVELELRRHFSAM